MRDASTALDLVEVEALLVERLGEPVADVAPIGGGAWSRAVRFRAAERALIVRFSATDADFRNDARAARFASAELPIPTVHAIGGVAGGWFAISDRLEGDHLEACDEPTMRSRLPSLFAALDAMRTADVGDSRGSGRWGPDGDGAHGSWREALVDVAVDRPGRRTSGWSARLAERPDAMRSFERAHRELVAVSADCPDARHVVHSDLLNRNVLAVGPRITGVLDWGSALYGDFVFDLAWLVVWAPWYEGWGRIDLLAEARAHWARTGLEVADLDRRLLACELWILLDGLAYLAWAGFDEPLAWTVARVRQVLGAGSRVRRD